MAAGTSMVANRSCRNTPIGCSRAVIDTLRPALGIGAASAAVLAASITTAASASPTRRSRQAIEPSLACRRRWGRAVAMR